MDAPIAPIALCGIFQRTPDDLIEPIVVDAQVKKTGGSIAARCCRCSLRPGMATR
ncbi:hypothetical protein [Streptomyces sp. NBC_01217]|uniref:hypothetical protein n=1 Tax=Streptomyces sp. NBC_01217 TaxID=2903779 RepID=UPI002E0F149F